MANFFAIPTKKKELLTKDQMSELQKKIVRSFKKRERKAEGQYSNIKLLHRLVDKKVLTQGDVCAILKEDYSSLPSHRGRKVKWQGKPYRLLEKNRSHLHGEWGNILEAPKGQACQTVCPWMKTKSIAQFIINIHFYSNFMKYCAPIKD